MLTRLGIMNELPLASGSGSAEIDQLMVTYYKSMIVHLIVFCRTTIKIHLINC